ncbi:MAG: AAA family ATPase [Dehalococcoidales bacterium]|nr:AAA family ATPase [Dehalococcoidales bacterium]
MSFSIAVAGKGGTGKTSLASLIIRYLKNNKLGPILAVDADPNANLAETLGYEVPETVGRILNQFQGEKLSIPPGMTKEAYLEYKLNGAIVEGEGLDLLTMGRGEGAECYCYPNTMLRKMIDTLSQNYAYVVMDNEAGMEHLSRRSTQNIDELLIVSDHSVRGVRTIARIKDLVSEIKLVVGHQTVIINFAPAELAPMVRQELDRLGIESPLLVPEDEQLYQYDLELKPLLDLPDTSKAVNVVNDFMTELLSNKRAETVSSGKG